MLIIKLLMVMIFFGVAAMIVLAALGDPPKAPSRSELDAMACSQMREQGWTEEEIKNYMDECGGYYDKD